MLCCRCFASVGVGVYALWGAIALRAISRLQSQDLSFAVANFRFVHDHPASMRHLSFFSVSALASHEPFSVLFFGVEYFDVQSFTLLMTFGLSFICSLYFPSRNIFVS